MGCKLFISSILATTALSLGAAVPAWAQDTDSNEDVSSGNDIIVTAQRIEQRLQDVPISVTVLSQETLSNNNVTNAKDLAIYTPGLSTNNRFGSDNTTFSIRGFAQEQRTTATVGTYFADVVAPRGSGATFGGDGAGPGALFDLQNVQVLKGPQGTLFGRNSTGGAVLLVPRKPTDRLEGYVEASAGDYSMYRAQAVVNIPVMDSLRIRIGGDHMKRDGFLKNIGNFGDGKFGDHGMGDVNYWALRFSAVADLTPDVENYTVVTVSHSQNNGVIPAMKKCLAAGPTGTPILTSGIPTGRMACAQLAREQAHGFWTVSNRIPDSASIIDQWQFINTTTWKASDSLTVKNIFSYGELRGVTNFDVFGNYFIQEGVTPGTETGNQVTGFSFTHAEPTYGHTNAQSTMVEELQFQGHPGDGRFTWQAGLYMEISNPLGYSGVQTTNFTPCADVTTFNCAPAIAGLSLGSGAFSLNQAEFRNYAVYAQASYNLTEKLKLTAGIRYTWDKVSSQLINQTINYTNLTTRCSNLTAPGFGAVYQLSERFAVCRQSLSKNTKAPTWVLGLDYKPIEDIMLYAKWSRGYRQGGLSFFGPDPIQPYDAEKVDTYEAGAKASWRGALPGFFNISGFYNNFSNQQLFIGVACDINQPNYQGPCAANAAVVNAAKSRLYGFEADLGLTAFDRLHLTASYGYLNTHIQEFVPPVLPFIPGVPSWNSVVSPKVLSADRCALVEFCDVIPGTIPHKLTLSAMLDLPLPESVGELSVGGTFVYTSRYRVVAEANPNTTSNLGIPPSTNNGVLPGSKVFNLNVNWENVGGMPVDASFFVTNLTNEHVFLQVNDSFAARGFLTYIVGEPRMWGGRLRYKF